MTRPYSFIHIVLCLGLAATAPAQVGLSVVNSQHNLSSTGPGKVRSSSEQQVCIFCHTPHHASATQPLWNRNVLPQAYKPYASTSLQAKPGQPTGTSKLCLSCHDGMIALGNVVSRNQPITMAQGMTVMPAGRSNLGTDLSDDHPISFRYDAALRAKNPKLKDPSSLTYARLDSNQELQCTTCHDAHDNSNSKFLVMTNSNSELCNACHTPGVTTVAGHRQCAGCHQPHTAPSGPWLLKKAKVAETCGQCHSGGTGANQGANVMADINKSVNHDTSPVVNILDHAKSSPVVADCTDCHGKHTMTKTTATAPLLPGRFGDVPGMNSSGGAVAKAQYEYEVCFRCHGNMQTTTPVSRQFMPVGVLKKFASPAVSYHPVASAGRNSNVPSLLPGWTTASLMYCGDCHGSETGHKAGGTGPDGVHGSGVSALLSGNYNTSIAWTAESATVYALCYRCHDRNKILATSSTPFNYHKKHLGSEVKATCSFCHDAHGSTNPRLINFDTRYVGTNLTYTQTSTGHGRCNGACHGKSHNESY